MPKKNNHISLLSRRKLLSVTAGLGALAFTSKKSFSKVSNPNNLPPNIPEWTEGLGDGVDANPYGSPSEFESHVIRRNVELNFCKNWYI